MRRRPRGSTGQGDVGIPPAEPPRRRGRRPNPPVNYRHLGPLSFDPEEVFLALARVVEGMSDRRYREFCASLPDTEELDNEEWEIVRSGSKRVVALEVRSAKAP